MGEQNCPEPRPLRELKGFSRVTLNPGQTKRVEITLPRHAFAYWSSTTKNWTVDAGNKFTIEAGVSERDISARETLALQLTHRQPVILFDLVLASAFVSPISVLAIVIELNTHHRRRRRGCFTAAAAPASAASALGSKRNHGAGLVVVGGGGDVVTATHDVIAVEPALGDPQAIF